MEAEYKRTPLEERLDQIEHSIIKLQTATRIWGVVLAGVLAVGTVVSPWIQAGIAGG